MSFAAIIGSILFGALGFVAFTYGKKQLRFKIMWLGVVLMVYPYFIPNTIALYCIGILLTVGLFVIRD